MSDIPLQCACGELRGIALGVVPGQGNRLICACGDCQAFAHYLEQEGRLLDENGGSEIYQLSPSQLRFTEGQRHLRCMRLSEKGLLRWYAGCCGSPVANTLPWAKVPFAGVSVALMKPSVPLEDALGPLVGRVHGAYGQKDGLRLGLRTLRLILGGLLRGRHRASPFFREGKPRVEPTVLEAEARERLAARCA